MQTEEWKENWIEEDWHCNECCGSNPEEGIWKQGVG